METFAGEVLAGLYSWRAHQAAILVSIAYYEHGLDWFFIFIPVSKPMFYHANIYVSW